MKELYDNGNLRISWKTYYYDHWFRYHKYAIYNQNGDDHFLLLGPLQFRWWKMKDYSRMISRSDYFRAMETYHKMIRSLNLSNPPDFRLFMPALPSSNSNPVPFRRISESELVELTQEGYRHFQLLSNSHATTLLAIWVAQHENQPS